jgi:hypothetical protein
LDVVASPAKSDAPGNVAAAAGDMSDVSGDVNEEVEY